MKKYEYKIVTKLFDSSEDKLNQYGLMGWELVSVNVIGFTTTFYFKREIQ